MDPKAARKYVFSRAVASNRPKSQDCAEVFERDDKLVVALGDGASGIRGSDVASATLIEAVRVAVGDRTFAVEDPRKWVTLFEAVDLGLAAHAAGETSGIVVVVGPGMLLGVSTGDSEAWAVTTTRIDKLTVGQQTKQRLGSRRVTPTSFERHALDGVLLVGTDGLFKFAAGDVIAQIVRSSDVGPAAEKLIDLVRLPSGKLADDAAVVLLRSQASRPS